jgi:hypothetical protein
MMENQHLQIRGYRDLSPDEVGRMNGIKRISESVGGMIEELQQHEGADQRWVAIAKTHLQQGFMAAVRAVAKPTTF